MKTHFYLKAGDKRLLGDVFRPANDSSPSKPWKFVATWGDIVTEEELKNWMYFRPSREWIELHMQPNLIDVFDQMTHEEHPNTPYFNGDHWAVPYLVTNAGGSGGGVGAALFNTLREAMVEALKLKPLD
jgi:hypothetical protein